MADITDDPGSVAAPLAQSGEHLLTDAKAKVLDAVESQRRRAADAVRGMAGALHRAAGDLKPENETMGRYTDMAAERLDRFAGYLRKTDWAQVLEESEDLVRRQPAWFIGGALAAGFLLARAVKNTSEPRRRYDRQGQRLAAAPAAAVSPMKTPSPIATGTPLPGGSLSGGPIPGAEV